MTVELHPILRMLHIVLGAAGFILGAAAILLPKFSKKSVWHRWIGRAYAVSMIAMALISIPLSIWGDNLFLLVIGIVTLFWVVGGWVALRRVRRSHPGGKPLPASDRLRWHVTWMGSSYIAAWTAFLVNVRPIGAELPWMIFYSIAPSIVGSFLIARTIVRLTNQRRRNAERLSIKVS
jgi:hypothetical protein